MKILKTKQQTEVFPYITHTQTKMFMILVNTHTHTSVGGEVVALNSHTLIPKYIVCMGLVLAHFQRIMVYCITHTSERRKILSSERSFIGIPYSMTCVEIQLIIYNCVYEKRAPINTAAAAVASIVLWYYIHVCTKHFSSNFESRFSRTHHHTAILVICFYCLFSLNTNAYHHHHHHITSQRACTHIYSSSL